MSAASPDPAVSSGGRPVTAVVYDAATITARVEALGAEITRAYPGGELLVLGLLKGSFIFLADLVRSIRRPLVVDFLVASSYGTGTVSGGEVQLTYEPTTTLAGKHILLVEDIIDSGNTLKRLAGVLAGRAPASLAACALLHKRLVEDVGMPVPFVGFDAPPAFLVGYGLDHAEHHRHLPFIAELG